MRGETLEIYCCGCKAYVEARITNGREVYPMRKDLHHLKLAKCDMCGNYVGCHQSVKDKGTLTAFGCIPTRALREARRHVHRLLDPMWKSGAVTRTQLYARLSADLGWTYHTGDLRSVEEARKVYKLLQKYRREQMFGKFQVGKAKRR